MVKQEDILQSSFKNLDLGDFRLERKCISITRDMLENPSANVYNMSKNNAGLKSSYRFYKNDNFAEEEILKSHRDSIKEKINNESNPLIYIIQDTTTLNFNHILSNPDLLPLSRNQFHKNSIRGYFLHLSLVLNQDFMPLGIDNVHLYGNLKKKEDKKNIKNKPIEQKKSYRWIEGVYSADNMDDNKKLIGVVSIGDVVNKTIQDQENMIHQLEDYIIGKY